MSTYIKQVFDYNVPTNLTTLASPEMQYYQPNVQIVTIESLFDYWGPNASAVYSMFASITKPDGKPFIDMTSFETVMEVINLAIKYNDANKAYLELSQLAKQKPDALIPWDLQIIKPFYEERKETTRLEFEPIKGKPRPDGRLCPHCGIGTEIYEGQLVSFRSIDEETTSTARCVTCDGRY